MYSEIDALGCLLKEPSRYSNMFKQNFQSRTSRGLFMISQKRGIPCLLSSPIPWSPPTPKAYCASFLAQAHRTKSFHSLFPTGPPLPPHPSVLKPYFCISSSKTLSHTRAQSLPLPTPVSPPLLSEEHCMLPSGVWGRALAANDFCTF